MSGLSPETRRLMVRNQILAKLTAADVKVEDPLAAVATFLSYELVATVDEITAAAVAAFKAEAADELTVEAMRHSGIAHSLCDAYMRAARIVRNLSAEVA